MSLLTAPPYPTLLRQPCCEVGAWGAAALDSNPLCNPDVGARTDCPWCSDLLPGQRRYCEYLARALHHPALLPATASATLLLSSVVCRKLGVFVRGTEPPWFPNLGGGGGGGGGGSASSTPRTGMSAASSWASLQQAPGGAAALPAQAMLIVFCRGAEVWRGGVLPGSIDDEVSPTTAPSPAPPRSTRVWLP